MSSAKKRINLVPREGFEFTTTGRLLSWSLSIGRIVVITTELVVIIAFLSRFWLDKTLSDLHESNDSKQKQVESSRIFESDFRSAQFRLANYKKIAIKTNDFGKVRKIATLLPSGVTLNKIALTQKDFSVGGVSLSEEGLAGFMKGLSDNPDFNSVGLVSLSLTTEGQQGLLFTVKGNLSSTLNSQN